MKIKNEQKDKNPKLKIDLMDKCIGIWNAACC